jgi:hypothetical protein
MTRAVLPLLKKIALYALKVLALAFVTGMVLIQIPNIRYGLSSKTPVTISGPEELTRERFPAATFVSVEGKPNFEHAFVYRRYGLAYTYFTIDPYGMKIVARTHETVTDEWKQIHRFLGKLLPFERQPFSYRIRQIYRDRFQTELPENGFFLALDAVPGLNGWQIGAVVFGCVLWLVLFYLFFFFRWGKKRG